MTAVGGYLAFVRGKGLAECRPARQGSLGGALEFMARVSAV